MHKSELVNNLRKGLFLEKRGILIPWNTPFNKLCNFGNPILIRHPTQYTDMIWEDEIILNGISATLTIRRWKWKGIARMNKRLKYVIAAISVKELTLREKLNVELGLKGEYFKTNELKHGYVWKLKKCRIELQEMPMYELNCILELQYTNSFCF